jgi:hypothetical protein
MSCSCTFHNSKTLQIFIFCQGTLTTYHVAIVGQAWQIREFAIFLIRVWKIMKSVKYVIGMPSTDKILVPYLVKIGQTGQQCQWGHACAPTSTKAQTRFIFIYYLFICLFVFIYLFTWYIYNNMIISRLLFPFEKECRLTKERDTEVSVISGYHAASSSIRLRTFLGNAVFSSPRLETFEPALPRDFVNRITRDTASYPTKTETSSSPLRNHRKTEYHAPLWHSRHESRCAASSVKYLQGQV